MGFCTRRLLATFISCKDFKILSFNFLIALRFILSSGQCCDDIRRKLIKSLKSDENIQYIRVLNQYMDKVKDTFKLLSCSFSPSFMKS